MFEQLILAAMPLDAAPLMRYAQPLPVHRSAGWRQERRRKRARQNNGRKG